MNENTKNKDHREMLKSNIEREEHTQRNTRERSEFNVPKSLDEKGFMRRMLSIENDDRAR
jgi:hypothetical protein